MRKYKTDPDSFIKSANSKELRKLKPHIDTYNAKHNPIKPINQNITKKTSKKLKLNLDNVTATFNKLKFQARILAIVLFLVAAFIHIAPKVYSSSFQESEQDLSNLDVTFILPFDDSVSVSVSDGYGERIHPITKKNSVHHGIDFATEWHCEILAAYDGEVVKAENYGTYGSTVIICHKIGMTNFYTLYAHLSRIDVVPGQIIKQGTVIGLEGGDPKNDPTPGTSTGHHLHFGMMNSKMEYIDPTPFFE